MQKSLNYSFLLLTIFSIVGQAPFANLEMCYKGAMVTGQRVAQRRGTLSKTEELQVCKYLVFLM